MPHTPGAAAELCSAVAMKSSLAALARTANSSGESSPSEWRE